MEYTFRYLPADDGYQIYFIDEENELEDFIIPEYLLGKWNEFIDSINDRIPYYYEVTQFLEGLLS